VELRLAVLGDSIAWGQGASRAEERLAPRLAAGLAEHGVAVTTRVLAVPGARSADLPGQVERALPWRPDLAVVVIGANDLIRLVPTAAAVESLTDAVRRLRAAGTEVVVAPAPDLSSVPHVPPALRPLVRTASEELRRGQAAAVRRLGARVADGDHGTSSAFATDPRLFSADRFHPSSAGYAVIAEAILPELLAAAEPSAAG
jgi:lysophospholipase L1-like esterase